MAKIRLSSGGFKVIPEGVYVFKIVEVDDSSYEDFGKLVVKMQTKKGDSHQEQFTLINKDGEVNPGGLKAFSYFAKTALNNFELDDSEIETGDLVGCYIKAEIKHEKYIAKSGKNEGKEMTQARMNDWQVATGFGSTEEKAKVKEESSSNDDVDVDDFLND